MKLNLQGIVHILWEILKEDLSMWMISLHMSRTLQEGSRKANKKKISIDNWMMYA